MDKNMGKNLGKLCAAHKIESSAQLGLHKVYSETHSMNEN